MVTLTYPGDWMSLAPTASASSAHLRAFRHRLERATGPAHAILKREFQRRGAPHWHCMVPLPSVVGEVPVAEWISSAWFEVVGSGDPRHLRAGTGVDWSHGVRAIDPVRVARYFAGYSTTRSKQYQDRPPELWIEAGSVGRFWSVWRLKPAEASLYLSEREFIEVRRLLRRIDRAKRRTRVVTVRRVNRRTGEIRFRKVTRRADTRSLNQSRLVGGSLFTPDGPRLAGDVRRFLHSLDQQKPRPQPVSAQQQGEQHEDDSV
ncbi:MAG: hypothetical protein AAF567_11765 [Actinomycetota bacterium]